MRLVAPVAVAVLSLSSPALADESATPAPAAPAPTAMAPRLGDRGRVVVAAERLFGVALSSHELERGVGATKETTSTTDTTWSLLWARPSTAFNFPRLGLDWLVVEKVSVGLAAGYFSSGDKRTGGAAGVSSDLDETSTSSWLFAPRLGYVLSNESKIALWVRGGVTLFGYESTRELKTGARGTAKATWSGTALTFDPMVVITPVPHLGFYGGLALDIGLGGKATFQDPGVSAVEEHTYRASSYGVTFGLLGYL